MKRIVHLVCGVLIAVFVAEISAATMKSEFVREINMGNGSSSKQQLREPTGWTIGRDGSIWALDAGRGMVPVFSSERDDTPALTSAPAEPAVAFLREIPGVVASLAINGRLWGASGDSLREFAGPGKGSIIGTRGSKPASLKEPRGLAVDSRGNFWVADTGNDRLQKFSIDGSLLHVVGKQGSGEGEFRSLLGIAVSARGNIYIADTGNKRVQVLSAKGVFLNMFGKAGDLPGLFNEIVDIAVDALDYLYVVDRGNNRIAKYDSSGKLIWEQGGFRRPENIVISGDNEVYVLDAGNARVQVFDTSGKRLRQFGSEGSGPGQLRSPQGLVLEKGTHLYVGDRGNKRIQVFLLKHTPAMPRKVTALPKINEVQVSWKPGTESYLDHYRIYRADSPTDEFRYIGMTSSPFYLDKNLPSNKAFHYRVSSQAREGNESALSDFASAVTPKLIPAAPGMVKAEAGKAWITVSWIPGREPFVDHYRVYRTQQVTEGFQLLTMTDGPSFVDNTPSSETIYYYQITAVGREGDESAPSEVAFASIPGIVPASPSIRISRIDAGPLFAASQSYYESHPIARVVISNTTNTAQHQVKVSLSVKDLMDSPAEIVIPAIGANQQLELPFTARFNERMIEAVENTLVRTDVSLSYVLDGEDRTAQKRLWLTRYNRHAMQWSDKNKLGAFVTLEDSVVSGFSKFVVQQYAGEYPNLPQPIVYARALYNALGLSGVEYQVDQTSPYEQASTAPGGVGYMQYPRETLTRRSGDCDDLSLLFAAALENSGIETAIVTVPGRMFVMFNTGISLKDRMTLGFSDDIIVLYEDAVWIPVEMTVVGTSFTRAWQEGARQYRGWASKNLFDILLVRKAWGEFMPVALPAADAGIKVRKQAIEAAFRDELEMLANQRLLNLSAVYRGMLRDKPDDTVTLGRLGVLYSENGLLSEALEQFQKLLALDKKNALAYTHIGNISALQGRLDDARQAFEAVRSLSLRDSGIMISLVRVLEQMGRIDEARKLFQEAAAIDPRIMQQHRDLATKVGVK